MRNIIICKAYIIVVSKSFALSLYEKGRLKFKSTHLNQESPIVFLINSSQKYIATF